MAEKELAKVEVTLFLDKQLYEAYSDAVLQDICEAFQLSVEEKLSDIRAIMGYENLFAERLLRIFAE